MKKMYEKPDVEITKFTLSDDWMTGVANPSDEPIAPWALTPDESVEEIQ